MDSKTKEIPLYFKSFIEVKTFCSFKNITWRLKFLLFKKLLFFPLLSTNIEGNIIIPLIKSGCHKGHNCTPSISHILDNKIRVSDDCLFTASILIDFLRAIDTMDLNFMATFPGYSSFNWYSTRIWYGSFAFYSLYI